VLLLLLPKQHSFLPNSTAFLPTRHREHGGRAAADTRARRRREQQPSALTGGGQHGDAVVELGVVDDAGSTYWVRAATNKYDGGEGRGRRRCGWSVRWGGCGGHDDTEAGATHDVGARWRPAEGAAARRRVFRLGRGRRGLGENI
jgi:hypothetical protein